MSDVRVDLCSTELNWLQSHGSNREVHGCSVIAPLATNVGVENEESVTASFLYKYNYEPQFATTK